jgi:hypothetical protein
MRQYLLVSLVCVTPTALSGQLGELQVGAVASYGLRDPYRAGAGLVFGVAPGRLVYVGLRWIYYVGATTVESAPPSPADVRNRAQVFATDLDVQIPISAGRLELRPGIGLGMVQFSQRGRPVTGDVSASAKEFFAAPGVALQLSAGRIALIPEMQYYFTGHSQLSWPIRNKGLAASVRLVFLSEIRRIRR